jgi:DNA-binding CsgD family transcriptional regulator
MSPIPERLLEREDDLGLTAAAFERARRGDGLPILIEGPPGIGKTRLLQALGEQAVLSGFSVLTARATELEREFPFGLVRQLFEAVVAGADQEDRSPLLAGAAALALNVIRPEAGPAHEGSAPAVDPDYGYLHGLYWLTANLAERQPLLLAIDDAHWADAASLRFLSFLAPRLDGLALVLAITTRPREPGAGSGAGVELREHPDRVDIRPRPLSLAGVEATLRDRLGDVDDEVVQACHGASGGNPFFLTELIAEASELGEGRRLRAGDIVALGPDRVAASVVRRLERLGEDAVALASAVAVMGDRTTVAHAAALAHLDEPRTGRLADAMAGAYILQPERPLRFAHPIMRTAVYRRLAHEERSGAHREAARILLRSGAVEAAAVHLLSTDHAGGQWASDCLQEAASVTLARGAPHTARRFLERALVEGPDESTAPAIRFELARAAGQAGEEDAIERLHDAYETAANPRMRASVAAEYAMALHFLGKGEEGIAVTRAALAELDDEQTAQAAPLQALLLISAHYTHATRRQTLADIRGATLAAREPGASPVVLASAACELAVFHGEPEPAVELAERAFEQGLIAMLTADYPAIYPCADVLSLAGRYEQADARLSEAADEARARGSARGFVPASAMRALNRLRRGALADAEADARASEELMASDHIIRPLAVGVLATALIERGRMIDAEAALARFDPASVPAELSLVGHYWQAVAVTRLGQGRPHDALEATDVIAAWELGFGMQGEFWVPWRSLAALANARLGRGDEAFVLADEAVEQTRRVGAARGLGMALRIQALVADPDQREERLREAVSVLAASGARLEHARALIDLGAQIRRDNRARESRESLRHGYELADACGATPLADRAVEELTAGGARPQRRAERTADALTPAERRVAALAAEGRSNPEIAQALFVTRKTVETHLGSAYKKLGIASRVQLKVRLED